MSVGDVEHVFGALADRHDLRGVQVDALFHEHLADVAQQAGPVAGHQLQHRAADCARRRVMAICVGVLNMRTWRGARRVTVTGDSSGRCSERHSELLDFADALACR